MKKQEKFAVMVESGNAPKVLHDSFELAENEAIRLAKKTKDVVYVLKAVYKYEMTDVKVTNLD